MKRSLFWLLPLLSLLPHHGTAQNYIPMPLDCTYWRVHFAGMDQLTSCTCTADYIYKTAGDTVIGAFTYQKIKRVGPGGCFCKPSLARLGAIRQDTAARKIYIFRYSVDTMEQVLYDFSQTTGDTVNSILYPGPQTCPYYPVISSVDSILVNNVYHKRLNIQPNGCTYWTVSFIEGIGSTEGLLEPLIYDQEIYPNLVCVSHNGLTIFPDSTASCSDVPSGTEAINNNDFSIAVFPNPSNGKFYVQATGHVSYIEVRDLPGSIVYNCSINASRAEIDLHHMPPGIYFIRLHSAGKQFMKKIIIQ